MNHGSCLENGGTCWYSNGNSFHRSQRFKGSKDCVAVPAAARLVLAHAALKPDRVVAVQGEKTKTQPQIWCLRDLR